MIANFFPDNSVLSTTTITFSNGPLHSRTPPPPATMPFTKFWGNVKDEEVRCTEDDGWTLQKAKFLHLDPVPRWLAEVWAAASRGMVWGGGGLL
jgi:hypothetical protein